MSSRNARAAELTFEQATARLEEIDALMNNPETGLEETLALMEEGIGLIRRSRKMLQAAELKIQQLEAPEPEETPVHNAPRNTRRTGTPTDDEFSLL